MKLLFGIFLSLALSACTFGVPVGGYNAAPQKSSASTKPLKRSASGNPSSYIVMGKRYYVMDTANGFKQRGLASWYGKKFHGKRTSSGDIYNMHAMTAAHKTLPIPVYVKVKNLTNGKEAIVLVNDRGPFVDDRIIDLSYAAATKLGVVGPGTAKVEIVTLDSSGKASKSSKAPVRVIPLGRAKQQSVGDMFIQLGSFSSKSNAVDLSKKLKQNKETAVVIRQVKTASGSFFRVLVGPLLDLSEASSIQKRLKRKGYKRAQIVIEDNS